MFKKVVFLLAEDKVIDAVEKIVNELTIYRVKVKLIVKPLRNNADDNTWFSEDLSFCEASDVLYITDNPDCYMELRRHSLPTIVYLHEYNRDKNFPYAEYAIEQIEELEYESLKLAYQRLTGVPWTILETDRCIIRETTVEDVDSFYEIYKEPSITRYMDGLYPDRDEEIAYIQDYIRNVYSFYGYGIWTVLEKSTGSVIGRAGIYWHKGFDIPELGFVFALPFQGRGYAYEICQAIIRYGRSELGFTSFQVLIMEGNVKSMSLCKKLGFEYVENVILGGNEYARMLLSI